MEKKEALEKYGTESSGKNLPFSSLSEDLKKKEEAPKRKTRKRTSAKSKNTKTE